MKKDILLRCALAILLGALPFGLKAQKAPTEKINIIGFSLAQQNNKIAINWATDSKRETYYFEVEKSTDGKNFKTIAYVLGPDPSKTNCECYGCFDKIGTDGKKFYYRLKHVDADGNVERSEIKALALK